MILGCGVDLMDVARFEQEMARRGDGLIAELFSAGELAWCGRRRRAAEGYAMGYAAKEAVFKALGTGKIGGMAWRDIDIAWPACATQPTLTLSGEVAVVAAQLGVGQVHLAMACTRAVAVASVMTAGPVAGADRDVAMRPQPSVGDLPAGEWKAPFPLRPGHRQTGGDASGPNPESRIPSPESRPA